MNSDAQSIAAVVIVLLTILIFAVRIIRQKKNGKAGGCGSGCGCGPKKKDPLKK
jgi:hypothetical protein